MYRIPVESNQESKFPPSKGLRPVILLRRRWRQFILAGWKKNALRVANGPKWRKGLDRR
jgi:hypothetical protein